MSPIDRRDFVRALAVAAAAGNASADETPSPNQQQAKDVTRKLAHWIVTAPRDGVPAAVRKEATRTFLNWMGCAVGGSRTDTVNNALAALSPFAGPAQATILGRRERLDIMNAALANGISSHIFDYDDTHLRTVIHPAGPVASAILALSEYRPVSGRDFLHALVIGVEVECRIGNAVYPSHYDAGWHITGTTGVFGAAAATGRLLGLTEQQMLWALGLASVQPVGLKEMFGTMTKSFHPGRAAQNGLTAAFLASKNFTSSEQSLEAKAGWVNAVSTAHNYAEITENLGKTFEISLNTYKPFACGVVLHPAIDACIQLRNQYRLTADQIQKIDLRVHPLVLELTGKKTPQSGLEGKFSIYYTAAIAIVEGAAGEKQFSDRLVRDAQIVALRDRVTPTVDASIKDTGVVARITLQDGRVLEKKIDDAIGSLKNPMTDAALEAKFLDLAEGVLAPAKARRLMELCWKLESLSATSEVAKAAAG